MFYFYFVVTDYLKTLYKTVRDCSSTEVENLIEEINGYDTGGCFRNISGKYLFFWFSHQISLLVHKRSYIQMK